jgi:hypothetical protein
MGSVSERETIIRPIELLGNGGKSFEKRENIRKDEQQQQNEHIFKPFSSIYCPILFHFSPQFFLIIIRFCPLFGFSPSSGAFPPPRFLHVILLLLPASPSSP